MQALKCKDFSKKIRFGLQEVAQLIDYMDAKGLGDEITWERWSVVDMIEMLEQAAPEHKSAIEHNIHHHLPHIVDMLMKKHTMHELAKTTI